MTSYATKAPGVYVEESQNISLSVSSGETAVPVFAATATDFALLTDASEYVEIASWLDVTKTAATADDLADTMIYRALQAYFTNGGGRCYVASVGKIAKVALQLSDVTLLVQAGVPGEGAGKDGVGKLGEEDEDKKDEDEADEDDTEGNDSAASAISASAADIVDAEKATEVFTAAIVAVVCERNTGIFGILDTPRGARAVGTDGKASPALVTMGEGPLKSDYVAFYYPWLKSTAGNVPPSAVMAGIYARVDAERGVWKAPANMPVQGLSVATIVSDAVQGALNAHTTPVNVIRRFGSDAPTVWGARTGDVTSSFKYIPVRRLFSTIERDIKRAMRLAVFEPNTAATWEMTRAAIDHYLHEIWRRGGLMGTKPEEAYRVVIGRGVTMLDDDIRNGRMIVEVAVAPSRPAEFIILRFSEQLQKA